MSRTDRHRPYRVRVADPAERHNLKYGWDSHPWLINEGCLRLNCSCKAKGWSDSNRATRRRDRHTAARDITERMADQ